MAVLIGEIVTETVVGAAPPPAQRPPLDEAELEAVVRRATERVLELLRREWDR